MQQGFYPLVMVSFVDVWFVLAGKSGELLICYDKQRLYNIDIPLLNRCWRSSAALKDVQVVNDWMLNIRDAQVASDPRCRTLVLPALVMHDIVHKLNLLPTSDLDRHPAAIGSQVTLHSSSHTCAAFLVDSTSCLRTVASRS